MTFFEIDRIRRGRGLRPASAATWESCSVATSPGEARAMVEALQRLSEPYVYRIIERRIAGAEIA